MRFDQIIGNRDAVRALEGMAASGRIPHAMMLYENDGCGAVALVMAFLSEVFKDEHKVSGLIHPDVHYVYPVANGSKENEKVENLRAELFLGYWRELIKANPYALESEVSSAFGVEGKQTGINNAEAKEILETVYLSSVEGGYKAVVVYLPEKMNTAAANRLLKAIEEPPEKTLFLMITHAPEKVMQTISSRCQAIRVPPCSKEEIQEVLVSSFGKSSEEAAQAALVAGGSVGVALQYLSGKEEYQEQVGIFRNLMEALSSRDLTAALACGEEMASLGSREKQKAFCNFAADCIRKIFMMQQGLEEISGIMPQEKEFYMEIAGKCGRSFCRSSLDIISRAASRLERNVNQKMIFCNMASKMFCSVRQ